ncbi:hypothetical protein SUNI508_00533 [Seiridium unicorne]|uniref:Uncharacterized protein n=1 Tax=Seiridium unicorne TaxID=138068 RepID=A0ABR2V867_9PEZI
MPQAEGADPDVSIKYKVDSETDDNQVRISTAALRPMKSRVIKQTLPQYEPNLAPLCRDPRHAPYQYHTFENLEAPYVLSSNMSSDRDDEERWSQHDRSEPVLTVVVCPVMLCGILYLISSSVYCYWACGRFL